MVVLGTIFCPPCAAEIKSATDIALYLEVVLPHFYLKTKFAIYVPYRTSQLNSDDWELLVIFIKTKDIYIVNPRLNSTPLTAEYSKYLSEIKRYELHCIFYTN